ncbi:MAG: NAD-dependent epimerase/dehydratase family protein [Beijerinckiaceae bacterium]|nr:NAD-dependent epimerase/dehydratase family protein [Beijerinckiaceae bacterium]
MSEQAETVTPRIALVLGLTGGVGGATAKALASHGWQIRAMARDPERARLGARASYPVQWLRGDAMNSDEVSRAAEGAELIVHAVNPPQYKNWRGLALPMLANTIAAARQSGARIVLPGNVYVFGPDAWPVATESSPLHPLTRKGAVRVEMERMLREAAPDVRSLVVRAGDFFGPGSGASSSFNLVVAKGGRNLKKIVDLGRNDAGHSWAYLPDLAEAIVKLVAIQDRLADTEVVHFGGHWIEPGRGLAEAIRRVLHRPRLPLRKFPWVLVYLAAPFMELMRELIEMRYLWDVPLRLDNRKLVGLIGPEPHTPLDTAITAALDAATVR